MPALKVFQHICQQAGCNLRVECENAFDDMVGTRLVGRVEITRFSRRLEWAYDNSRGVWTQIERLPIHEGGLRQDVLGSLEGKCTQAPMARSATWRCHANIDARKLTNIRKTEQIGHDQLAAAVFVGAIGMQSIAATAGLGIDERYRQIVTAQKPGENIGCDRLPFGVTIRAPGGQTGGDRRRCLHRLLVERARRLAQFTEASGANGAEMPRRRRLSCHQPTQGSESGIEVFRCLRWPCPSASRLAAGAHYHTPGLPRTTTSLASRPTRGPTSDCRQEDMPDFPGTRIIGNNGAITVQTQQGEGQCAGRTKRFDRRQCLGKQGGSPSAS